MTLKTKEAESIRAALDQQPPVARVEGFKTNGTGYADTGCFVSDLCTQCPLPKCRHEMSPAEQQMYRVRERDVLIHKLRDAGATAREIAEAGGISTRNVHRILKEVKA